MSDTASVPLRRLNALIYPIFTAGYLLLNRKAFKRNYIRHLKIVKLIKRNNNGTLTNNQDACLQDYVNTGFVILGPIDDRWIPHASLSSKAIQELFRIRKSPR